MKRRAWMRLVGGLVMGGVAGCVSGSSPGDGTDSRDRTLLEFGEFSFVDGVWATTTGVHVLDVVAYDDPADGSRTVWNPADDGGIAVASFVAQKRPFEKVSWPSPSSFRLRTTDGVFDRRERTPDGTSVHEISWPTGASVSRPVMSGGDGVIRREWETVYLLDTHSPDAITTTWTTPNPPSHWLRP